MSEQNPNLEGEQPKDATIANPSADNQETATEKTENPRPEGEQDLSTKAAASFKEAMRLKAENERLQKERDDAVKAAEDLRGSVGIKDNNFDTPPAEDQPTEELVPGFKDLEPEQQESIQRLSDSISKRTRDEIYKDPAISFARKNFNEKTFDDAFKDLKEAFPELKDDAKAKEFKQKYFNPNNVPNNIAEILPDVAKIFLFDSAKNIGVEEERERANRIDTERQTAGEKTNANKRTLEEWQQLQQRDPAKFASLSKEFNAALAEGSI